MSIRADVLREFDARFAFPLDYERAGARQTIRAYLRGLNEREQAALVGDLGQNVQFFMATITALQTPGFFPPQKFDRVTFDGLTYSLETWRIAQEQGVATFVKGYVKG